MYAKCIVNIYVKLQNLTFLLLMYLKLHGVAMQGALYYMHTVCVLHDVIKMPLQILTQNDFFLKS